MLGKLLKYEIKATSRTLLPVYLVLLVVAVINRFLNPFEILNNAEGFNFQIIVNLLSVVVYFLVAASVMAITFITMIQRFHKNLLGDEGYLSFTLPVKTWQHILSKMITSIIWVALSALSIIASLLIVVADLDSFFREFSRFLEELGTVFGNGIFIALPIYTLLGIILSILVIYNSISIGHQFENHKVLASFVTYGAFYLITQIILLLTLLIFSFNTYSNLTSTSLDAPALPNADVFFGVVGGILCIMAVGHFISANYFLKNRLNLE